MSVANLFYKWIEPKSTIREERKIFSNQDLIRLILPLIAEQTLSMLVGMADTLMITYAGEAAVSGVSLVDMLNNFFIFLFSALVTGGAVVVSQYIGSKNRENGNMAAGQLVLLTFLISILLMALTLLFRVQLLHLLFGRVEDDVMAASMTYLLISAFSYPFLAVYNACSALFRSMGKTKVTMNVSILMNIINVVGNAVGIFVLHAGVAGVAVPSLISRMFAAGLMLRFAWNQENVVAVGLHQIFTWKKELVARILRIAIPGGVENGLFQLSKVALTSIIALFVTAQIAANGVATSIDYVAAIIGLATGLAIVTVVGQCVGAGDYEQADYYVKKILRLTYLMTLLLNVILVAVTPLILTFYSLSGEVKQLVFVLVALHSLFMSTLYPLAYPLANGMRAAGDVKFTMCIAILASVLCRAAFSYIFGVWLEMGIIGVWLAMGVDWLVRVIPFVKRYHSGKWKAFQVI